MSSNVQLINTVLVKTLTLTKVTDFRDEELDEIALKDVSGKGTPTVEVDEYQSFPATYTIIARLTDAQKTSLYDMQDDEDVLELREDGILLDYVFIEEVNPIYDGENHFDNPWKTTIQLVVAPP